MTCGGWVMPKLKFLDSMIGAFSPQAALERGVARERLRLFEAEPQVNYKEGLF